jgi:transcriptional antiterminator RfaH
MDEKQWYLIQTKPRQEIRAQNNLKQQGYKVYCPMLSVEKILKGKVVMKSEVMFSRYIFIQARSCSDIVWVSIRSTPGVSNFVSFGGEPAKVESGLIEQLLSQEQQVAPEKLFNKGECLLLTSGPFAGFEGFYKADGGEGRAIVLLDFLGKATQLQVQTAILTKLN